MKEADRRRINIELEVPLGAIGDEDLSAAEEAAQQFDQIFTSLTREGR
ncbi:MAG: hypothetical protein H0T09_00300 [Actinobacteria bacterium]|nr:hypothetical protein [Actinomycetota bacterium]